MKRIELYVDGQHVVIEECEGRAEIRLADQPRVMAHPRMYITIGRTHLGEGARQIELKVEATE